MSKNDKSENSNKDFFMKMNQMQKINLKELTVVDSEE